MAVSYNAPVVSYQQVRQWAEKWRWRDAKSGIITTGYKPPHLATEKARVPFFVEYVTLKGVVERGHVVCLKVYPRRNQRMVQFVESREIRIIADYLILQIDGTRFVTR